MFTITIENENTRFMCNENENITTAAERNLVNIPIGCKSGGCGMCKILVKSGEYSTGTSSFAVLPESEREMNYSLACKTYPQEDMTIYIPRVNHPS